MTQEDKELLLKDLCARLPYGVIVEDTRCKIRGSLHDLFIYPKYKGDEIYDYIACTGFYHDCYYDDIVLFKPYLFPMSSMTEEQKNSCSVDKSIINAFISGEIALFEDEVLSANDIINLVDWLNKNHFDYRGLIEKGLALDATNLNIY